jgi:hypothetical protein
MEDYDGIEDPTLMQVEALCNLAEAYHAATNKEVKQRLMLAMDAVIIKLAPPAREPGKLVGLLPS